MIEDIKKIVNDAMSTKQYEVYYSRNTSIVLMCLYNKFSNFESAFQALYSHLHYSDNDAPCEYRILERDMETGKKIQVYKRVFTSSDVQHYHRLDTNSLYYWCFNTAVEMKG